MIAYQLEAFESYRVDCEVSPNVGLLHGLVREHLLEGAWLLSEILSFEAELTDGGEQLRQWVASFSAEEQLQKEVVHVFEEVVLPEVEDVHQIGSFRFGTHPQLRT